VNPGPRIGTDPCHPTGYYALSVCILRAGIKVAKTLRKSGVVNERGEVWHRWPLTAAGKPKVIAMCGSRGDAEEEMQFFRTLTQRGLDALEACGITVEEVLRRAGLEGLIKEREESDERE